MEKPTTQNTTLSELGSRTVVNEIDRSVIESALERTPTGGNSKPFYWNWIDGTLLVRHDKELDEHYLNRKYQTSWIALGCLIASVQIAAKSQGLKVDCKISWEEHTARFTFQNFSEKIVKSDDLRLLLQRKTYRGALQESPAPTLTLSSNRQIQIHLSPSQHILKSTTRFLTLADSYLWLQKKAARSFFKEVVFTANPQGKEDRGIRVVDFGIGKMDQMMLRLFSRMTWLPSLVARIPLLNTPFKANTKRTLKNAHLLLVTAEDLSAPSLVRAGEEAMKSWLELEKQGYQLQPLSTASITLVDAANGLLPEDTRPFFRSLFTDTGPRILKEQFHLNEKEKPVWLLRVGKASLKR